MIDNTGPDTAWEYMASRLYGKINQLQWRIVNVFMCGFGIGAIIATIVWFAIWHNLGQPDMTGFILD